MRQKQELNRMYPGATEEEEKGSRKEGGMRRKRQSREMGRQRVKVNRPEKKHGRDSTLLKTIPPKESLLLVVGFVPFVALHYYAILSHFNILNAFTN